MKNMVQTISKKSGCLFLVCILMTGLIGGGADDIAAAGKLRLSEKRINTGKIKEGPVLSRQVFLENIGDREVMIKNVSTS